jgi:hypothetical protein
MMKTPPSKEQIMGVRRSRYFSSLSYVLRDNQRCTK